MYGGRLDGWQWSNRKIGGPGHIIVIYESNSESVITTGEGA